MSILKKLFSKKISDTPLNTLEIKLQERINHPQNYASFHQELRNTEVILLGKVSEDGNLKLLTQPQDNFNVVYLFTSNQILEKMARNEKRENLEWVALQGLTFLESIKDDSNMVIYINYACDPLEYVLFPDERLFITTNY